MYDIVVHTQKGRGWPKEHLCTYSGPVPCKRDILELNGDVWVVDTVKHCVSTGECATVFLGAEVMVRKEHRGPVPL